jgi:hypothetical protein
LYEVRVDPGHGFVHVRFTGRLKASEGLNAIRDIATHPDFRPGMNGLLDTRELTGIESTSEDLREAAQLVASQAELYRGSRWAVVADSPVPFGMARQYQAMRDELPYELEVFRNADEACAWLGIPPC